MRPPVQHAKILRIRGGQTHRFIGIWVVTVQGRAFVRSWAVTARGWYHALKKDPRGAIKIGARSIAVRAVPARVTDGQGAAGCRFRNCWC